MPNRRYTQFFNTLHTKPILIDCQFKVAAADTGGKGVTGLIGPGVQNVYMHTSQTPASGSPNPAAGYIYVQLQDSYNGLYGLEYMLESANSGSDVNIDASDAALTVGQVYVISSLGTSLAADWVAIGVPIGTAPAVGVAFVAAATGAGTGTGKVQLPKATGAGISHIEVVGKPALSIASKSATVAGQTNGSYLVLQCLKSGLSAVTSVLTMASYTPAGTITNGTPDTFAGTPAVLTGSIANSGGVLANVAAAPADGTVIGLQMYFSGSMIKVQGE